MTGFYTGLFVGTIAAGVAWTILYKVARPAIIERAGVHVEQGVNQQLSPAIVGAAAGLLNVDVSRLLGNAFRQSLQENLP